MKTKFYILLLSALLIMSCNTIEKMVEQGRYDEAFALGIKKLKSNRKKKTNHVMALEKAYAVLNQKDKDEIKYLMEGTSPATYPRVLELYKRLEHRQALVHQLTPLTSKDGYTATFSMQDYRGEKSAILNTLLAYLYDDAANWMIKAQNGDKRAARKAYTVYNNIMSYNTPYKDTELKAIEAHQLGMEHIAIDIPRSGATFDHNHLLDNIDLRKYNTFWQTFHIYEEGAIYDNYVNIQLDYIDPGYEREYVTRDNFSREIEDGFKIIKKEVEVEVEEVVEVPVTVTEKDKNGESNVCGTLKTEKKIVKKKVKKIEEHKEPILVWVHASILEVRREKRSTIGGKMLVYNNESDGAVSNIEIGATTCFNDEMVEYSGDRRALPDNICSRLGSFINPFPSDWAVTNDLMHKFRLEMDRAIKNYNFLEV